MKYPYYISAFDLLRQVGAVVALKKATGWQHFYRWLVQGSWQTIPVAAGSIGMGCIGFPYHPVWEVTQACNLRCLHCHVNSQMPEPDELNTEEGMALIDSLSREHKFKMLVYTGGEPLVREDLDQLLCHSSRCGIGSVIATNGTLIDEARARELKRLNVRGVAISLDHTDPSVHNRIRNDERAYELAIRGIEACRKAGILVQINFTAMALNIDNVKKLLQMGNNFGARIALCYQLVCVGRGECATDIALGRELNEKLIQELIKIQADLPYIVEPVAAPQYWSALLKNSNVLLRFIGRRTFHGCTAGWGLVYIKANGDVWPCPFVPVSGGSIRKKSFNEIWSESIIFKKLRDRNNLSGRCGRCKDRGVCGGCRGKAWVTHHDPLAEDPDCPFEEENAREDKHTYISRIFASIAKRYDLSNTILSFGMDKHWRKTLVRNAGLKTGDRVLDVATGTGNLAGEIAKLVGESNVIGIDFCQEMLDIAGNEYKKITFIKAFAEKLPFPDNEFDCVTTGFTLRNMPDIEILFREMRRVTKIGGKVVALELSRPDNKFLNKFHLFYLKRILPYVGGMITGHVDAYKYLTRSINDFRNPDQVVKVMKKVELTGTVIHPLTFRTATIYTGIKV